MERIVISTFDDYQAAARKTAIYPNLGKNIYYTTLGLCGEVGEMYEKIKVNKGPGSEKEIRKEYGDILWYLANSASELGVSLNRIMIKSGYASINSISHYHKFVMDTEKRKEEKITITDCNDKIVVYSGKIADKVKKIMRDTNNVISDETKNTLIEYYGVILYSMTLALGRMNENIADAADENIQKLYSRMERNKLKGSGDNR